MYEHLYTFTTPILHNYSKISIKLKCGKANEKFLYNRNQKRIIFLKQGRKSDSLFISKIER